MTAQRILQSDLLDILFEGKNKTYGAYELRKQYNHRLKKALAGTFILISLLAIGNILANKSNSLIVEKPTFDTTRLSIVELPVDKPKEEPPIEKPKQNLATVKDFVPIILPDEKVPKTEVPDIEKIDTSAYGLTDKEGEKTDIISSVTPEPIVASGGTGNPIVIEPEQPTGPIDMKFVEQLPEYPGGREALGQHMMRSLTSELDAGVKYVVQAMFIIDEEGNVSDAQIIHSDDESLNNQVLRAIKRMKQWKPGIQNGHPVAVRFSMPVTFMGAEE